jgi:hypothetical protein
MSLNRLHVVPQKALDYLHGQWPKLTGSVENRASSISNEPYETAIR